MLETFETENEFGKGVVMSWASILDENTRKQAEKISRVPILEGHMALMPDAHFGYGPPVGSAIKTRGAVMPYAVGVDIGCGMIAVDTHLQRGELTGKETRILESIRDLIPSGVGMNRDTVATEFLDFQEEYGLPQGIHLANLRNKRGLLLDQRESLVDKLSSQFGTLGAGNHFVEVCEDSMGIVWLVLHSGSRGIGNILATAHQQIARKFMDSGSIRLEDNEFAWLYTDSPEGEYYIEDMLWAQHYAYAQRETMMNRLVFSVEMALGREIDGGEGARINCHHNYAEELERGVWLTRKGAINAEKGRMGIIPGSMGAATYIVEGKGEPESYQTSPHGAGRIMGRKQAHRELDIEDFRVQMRGKTWLDRDAEKLLDEAPAAYKPIETVMADSADLVMPVAVLTQFINYKGL